MRICHHCGRDIGAIERVGRRDTCLCCDADLHCCRNCEFFDPQSHNQCREPQAERQVDKECGNFCDYFSFAEAKAAAAAGAKDARTALDELFASRRKRS
jgi:hypothetical protein